jgi:hypothetical protein
MADPRSLITGHTTGILGAHEKRLLYAAALDDPDLFAELADEEWLRQMISDRDLRQELAELLAQGRGRSRVLNAWFWAPAVLAAAALVVALLWPVATQWARPDTESLPPEQLIVEIGTDLLPADHALLPGFEPHLELDRGGSSPRYELGSGIRYRFRLPRRGQVRLVEARADGSQVLLFPNHLQPSGQVAGGITIQVPPDRLLAVTGPLGPRSVHLLVFEPQSVPNRHTSPIGRAQRSFRVVSRGDAP